MPFPEPVSWDRKEIYRDRRPVKSEPLGSSPVVSRWNRDSPSFSYRGHHHGSGSRRGFTDYCRPPGRGRQQSDWQMFPEETGYGYMPSRSCERVIEDRGYWTPSSSRVDGRYRSGTDYYKVRGYQKDWEGPNWQQNNSYSAVSAGKPFNGSPVFYGGKPCNGYTDIPVERRDNGMHPGFGTERQRHLNASPVICNGRPSNGSVASVEKSRNGYSPRNTSDRPFSFSPAVSVDKQCLGYSNSHINNSRNGFSGPSVVKVNDRINQSYATERPTHLSSGVSGDRASDIFSSSPDVKAYDRLSPHDAAERSNHISSGISRPCFVPINAAIEKTGDGCSDALRDKTVAGCSSIALDGRAMKVSSDIPRDTPNHGVSRAPVEKTPYNNTNLADGDKQYLKPSGTPVENICYGLAVISEEKHGNSGSGGSSTNVCDVIARSNVTYPSEVKIDGKISNNELVSDCLQMVSENHSLQHLEVEVGEIIEPCNVSKHEKENFLGADWKPLVWTRSGSLSSRGHSSSSRSVPVDSNVTVDVSLKIKGTALCSPSGDAADCFTSSATSGEAPALKKARLGWGQGLAKYEKKIVVDTHGLGKQDGIHSPKVIDKCTSPSTPTSALCSSSQGKEFKSLKEENTPDSPTVDASDNVPSSLEKQDMNVIRDEVQLLLNAIYSEDQCPTGSGPQSINALSKLLVWKTGILKAVEMTDSEIETLETKVQSSKSENKSNMHYPAASSSLDANGGTQSNKTITACSAMPMRLQVDSLIVRNDIDSPGTATSNPVVTSRQLKNPQQVDSPRVYSDDISANKLTQIQEICRPCDLCDVDTPKLCSDNPSCPNHDLLDLEESTLHKFIFAANKEEAGKAYDELAHLLSKNGTLVSVCQELPNDMLVRDEVAKRKKFLRFVEKAVTLKYRALQQLWKEDARLLEIRKHRTKSPKRLELGIGTRASQNAQLKSNLLHSRGSSTEVSTSLVPSSQTISLTSKLLSNFPVKVYKDELQMPPLILDEKEKQMSRFVSYNGLVEDPVAVEKERVVMNPWTPDEKETFLDNFAIFGKNFRKIASYLDHKTTADCVEFYYKNHKSSLFERTRKKPVRVGTQSKPVAKAAYMLPSGEKWNQELAAADVLARIGSSLSSESISQYVSSSFNHADVHRQWKRKKVGGKRKQTWTQEITSINVETCSGESCNETDFSSLDWTDEEKHMLLQAVNLYGNNFELVSKFVKTRYINECKTFYSKVKKRLGSSPAATIITTAGDSQTQTDIDDYSRYETQSDWGMIDLIVIHHFNLIQSNVDRPTEHKLTHHSENGARVASKTYIDLTEDIGRS